MRLHELKPAPGSRKEKRIVGRGEGSTLGQTCGRGQKGQGSRSGESMMSGFEGGQTPLMRRIPKRGFRHPSKVWYQPINVQRLEEIFESGTEINAEVLYQKGLIKSVEAPYKILSKGKVTKAFKVMASRFSKSSEEAIKKAGGSITAVK